LYPLFKAGGTEDMSTGQLKRIFGFRVHESGIIRVIADAARVSEWVEFVLCWVGDVAAERFRGRHGSRVPDIVGTA
jgi:hypothetical protein